MKTPIREAAKVDRLIVPYTAAEIAEMLHLPPGARPVVDGRVVAEVVFEWFEPQAERATAAAPSVTSGVAPPRRNDGTELVCERCPGRKIIGRGPFASHMKWHEAQDAKEKRARKAAG